jgi:hypothetical protein
LISAIINVLLIRALNNPKRAKKIAIGFDCLDVCQSTTAQISQTRLLYGAIIIFVGVIASALPWLSFRRQQATKF